MIQAPIMSIKRQAQNCLKPLALGEDLAPHHPQPSITAAVVEVDSNHRCAGRSWVHVSHGAGKQALPRGQDTAFDCVVCFCDE